MNSSTSPTIQPESPRVHFKNVLFATDLDAASAQAQVCAVMLARMFGSHLFVLHVEAGPGLSTRYKGAQRPAAKPVGKTPSPQIQELDTFFSATGVPFTLLIQNGEVQDVLNRVVVERSIDLIVLGTHGRHGVPYLFMGSMAENVARSSTCPVITVGPQANAVFDRPLQTILFATDFSEESKLALAYATSLAQEFHAALTVLHVAPKRERLVRDREYVTGYLLNRLKSLAPQSHFPWCAISHVVAFGDTIQEILDAAKDRKADLIVLGLHSTVRFTSHLPERLSYRVSCAAPCPVMSVLPGKNDLKLAEIAASLLASPSQAN